MAIKKSKEENLFMKGTNDEVLKKIEEALHKGGFSKVKLNIQSNQVTSSYKKFMVWGEIAILTTLQDDGIKVHAKSTANVDNIFALFFCPAQKILDQFKLNFR